MTLAMWKPAICSHDGFNWMIILFLGMWAWIFCNCLCSSRFVLPLAVCTMEDAHVLEEWWESAGAWPAMPSVISFFATCYSKDRCFSTTSPWWSPQVPMEQWDAHSWYWGWWAWWGHRHPPGAPNWHGGSSVPSSCLWVLWCTCLLSMDSRICFLEALGHFVVRWKVWPAVHDTSGWAGLSCWNCISCAWSWMETHPGWMGGISTMVLGSTRYSAFSISSTRWPYLPIFIWFGWCALVKICFFWSHMWVHVGSSMIFVSIVCEKWCHHLSSCCLVAGSLLWLGNV